MSGVFWEADKQPNLCEAASGFTLSTLNLMVAVPMAVVDLLVYLSISIASLANYTRFSAPLMSSRASVFVEWPREGCAFRPHPAESRARDSWDDRHVRMPFSKESVFPVSEAGARKTLQYR